MVAEAVGLSRRTVARLLESSDRADLTHRPDHIHLVLQAIDVDGGVEAKAGADPDASSLRRHPVDIVAGRDWVVTVHDGPLPGLHRLEATTEGETRLGALDAASFVAAVTDEILDDYLELVDAIEGDIDRLDQRALRGPAAATCWTESSVSGAGSASSAGRSRHTAWHSRRWPVPTWPSMRSSGNLGRA